MLRTGIVTLCILALIVPTTPSLAASEEPALPAWVQSHLATRGIDADARDITVVRTVIDDDGARTFAVSLAELPQEDPFAGTSVAVPSVPEVLAGKLQLHTMIQTDCAGYGATTLPGGYRQVEDASWPFGIHVALGPLAGGVAVGTGADPTNPANAFAIVNTDSGMTQAVGNLNIVETRLVIFGTCLLLIGQMNGTGVWVFN